jgi:hypothetical protein
MRRPCFPLLVALATVAGCETGAAPDSGASAMIRVAGAQFVPGAAPAGQDDGPKVRTLAADSNRVFPGLRTSSLSGSVDLVAQSVLIGWEGDSGYWIVPTGVPDALESTLRTFGASLAFSREVPAGRHQVEVRSVDAGAKVGPPSRFGYVVAAAVPEGALAVSLTWDNDSDLDLHLTLPNPDPALASKEPSIEIWPKHPSSLRSFTDPSGGKTAALLDVDSNGQCVIDGRREEIIAIMEQPPHGHYVVRVDTFALCGQTASRWKVTVYRNGQPAAEAIGVATAYDGYPAQGAAKFGQDLRPGTAGSGQTAVEFDL